MFDCDGLLLETESRWTMAEEEVCRAHGAAFSMDLKRAMLGSSMLRAGEILAEWIGLSTVEGPRMGQELLDAYRDVLDREGVAPMPGAERLVRELAEHMPIGVASNTNIDDTRRALEHSGLPNRFTAIVCAGGDLPPKPAPDLYAHACDRLGTLPADAIAFEDSPLGVTAATRAGMFVVGVPSTVGVSLQAHHVASSLEEFALSDLVR